MTQPANRRLVTEDRFLVTEAEAAAAYDAVTSIASLSPNYIINGAFDFWQRGTSFSITNSSQYCADRWVMANANGTSTVTQQTFTPGVAPVSGYEGTYFLRHAVTTIGTMTSLGTYQRIENVRTLAGTTATISFWAKADSARTMSVRFDQDFGTGGSPSSYLVGAAQTLSIGATWTRYTLTFSIPSIASKTLGTNNDSKLVLITETTCAAGSYIDLWGVQIERGSTATAFRRNQPNIQAELAACQRYYYRMNAGPANNTYFAAASFWSNGAFYCPLIFPVQMRVTPTGGISSISHLGLLALNSNISLTSFGSVGATVHGGYYSGTCSAGTAGQSGTLWLGAGTGGWIDFGAEL